MAPAPEPTPAPQYSSINYDAILSSALGDLSSALGDLSSIYSPYLSSYDPNYLSSILSDYYKSGYNPYSLPSISIPTYVNPYLSTTARATRTPTRTTPTGTTDATNTAPPLGAQNTPNTSKGGLSSSAKIGMGVGIPVAVLALLGLGLFLWCAGKRKGKKAATTPFQPYAPTPNAPHVGVAYTPGQAQMPPPPQYVHGQQYPGMTAYQAAGVKQEVPVQNVEVAEMEHEYHFARPGVVEMGPGGRG